MNSVLVEFLVCTKFAQWRKDRWLIIGHESPILWWFSSWTVPYGMYIRGFTKFGIKVLWRLQFLMYLRTLRLKFQKTRTKIEVVMSLPCRLSQLKWDSGQLQFWSESFEILNVRSSNIPGAVAFTIPWYLEV